MAVLMAARWLGRRDRTERMMEPDATPQKLVIRPDPLAVLKVPRINRMPMVVAGAIATFVVFIISAIMVDRAQRQLLSDAPPPESARSSQAALTEVLDQIQPGAIPMASVPVPTDTAPSAMASTAVDLTPEPLAELPAEPGLSEQELQRIESYQQTLLQRALDARMAPLAVAGGNTPLAGISGPAPVGLPGSAQYADRYAQLLKAAQGQAGAVQQQDWMQQQAGAIGYLPHRVRQPVTSCELTAGSVIPATLRGGANSDLPGMLTAHVSMDVYSTADGSCLVIPQGTELVGVYNAEVKMGQERIMVAWQRLNLPDGSKLDLGSMPGTDAAGYAGFQDQVDNHYGRIFGNAILLSIVSAGIQLSQPQQEGDEQLSSSQVAAGALGQNLGQVSTEMIQKNMAIAPTLRVRPAYRFNVTVNKDIIFESSYGTD